MREPGGLLGVSAGADRGMPGKGDPLDAEDDKEERNADRRRPDWAPPKYSATIAPMSESVALTFTAVKMYGRAFGMRTSRKTSSSRVAYERMSSSDAGSTRVRPRSVLIMIGKNTSTATTIIFESGFKMPNQLFMMGANAMIGPEFAAIANGSNTRLAATQRAVANPTT